MSAHTAVPVPGFADPVHDAQGCFRALLDAMAHPGRIVRLDTDLVPPAPLHLAAAATLLSLADVDTPVWLDQTARTGGVLEFLRFHCGCPLVAARERATFALVAAPAEIPPLGTFSQGSDDYPDRAATVIVQVETLTDSDGWQLDGPGIDGSARLSALPLGDDFAAQLRANHNRYPRGVDVVLTAGAWLAALPRSTRIGD